MIGLTDTVCDTESYVSKSPDGLLLLNTFFSNFFYCQVMWLCNKIVKLIKHMIA